MGAAEREGGSREGKRAERVGGSPGNKEGKEGERGEEMWVQGGGLRCKREMGGRGEGEVGVPGRA